MTTHKHSDFSTPVALGLIVGTMDIAVLSIALTWHQGDPVSLPQLRAAIANDQQKSFRLCLEQAILSEHVLTKMELSRCLSAYPTRDQASTMGRKQLEVLESTGPAAR